MYRIIRTAAVVLAATASFGGAAQAIAPANALAKPNNHAYQRSSEARKQQQDTCNRYKENYDWGVQKAIDWTNVAGPDGDEMVDFFAKYANENRDNAKAIGCAWAS
jgi:hypothetical protein